MITNTKDLDKNTKLQDSSIESQDKVKDVLTEYWDLFCEDGFCQLIQDFHSRLTQITIHLSSVNHLGMVLMSMRLCKS